MKVTREVEERIEQMIRDGEVIENGSPMHREDVAEKEFQAEVIRRGNQLGYLSYHTYDSRRSQKGFPDTVMVGSRVLFVELKSEEGSLTKEQMIWLDRLKKAGELAFCFRPRDWPELERLLVLYRPNPEVAK